MPKTVRKKKTKSKTVAKKSAEKPVLERQIRTYELTMVLSSIIKPEKRKDVIGTVKKLITAQKGSVTRSDEWGLRELAYAIDKQLSGWYAHFVVDLPADGVAKLDKELRENEKLLRYLIVKIDKE